MDRVTTKQRKFNCLECGNEITVPEDKKVEDFFECEFCGIEYEIVEETEATAENPEVEMVVQIVEEEK